MVSQTMNERWQTVQQRVSGLRVAEGFGRDTLVFLAGAEAFHTLTHVWWGLSGMLPMEIPFPPITMTAGLNAFAIVINGLIMAGLLYWATRFRK
jgi:hypothetical protein